MDLGRLTASEISAKCINPNDEFDVSKIVGGIKVCTALLPLYESPCPYLTSSVISHKSHISLYTVPQTYHRCIKPDG